MDTKRVYSLLYIEDNLANRQLVQFIIARKDYLTLQFAADGQTGLDLARKTLPDLILLDISLPDMNGYHVLASLREEQETAGIPIIIISGDTAAAPPADVRVGPDSYLTKPIEVEPLYQAIDTLLGIA